jgi:hypothetical protein
MPNAAISSNASLESFQVPLEYVELLSGVTFFPRAFPLSPSELLEDVEFKEVEAPSSLPLQETSAPSPPSPKEETTPKASSTEVTIYRKKAPYPFFIPEEDSRLRGYSDLCAVSTCVLPPPEFWSVSPERKEELQIMLEDFAREGEGKFQMPSSLSAAERKWVHQVSEKLGLDHYSTGPPTNRLLVVERKSVALLVTSGVSEGTNIPENQTVVD